MTHPGYIQEKARAMRRERRMTIDEISARLALPRTTVFHWVRDIVVPRSAFDPRPMSEARARAAKANSDKHARVREEAYQAGAAEFPSLAAEPTFVDFVCMYIGEGSKKSRHRVEICNSDPAVVRLGHAWITRLTRNQVGHSLQYHTDQDPDELCVFWSSMLRIDPAGIRLQRKSNSGKLSGRSWRSEWGVLTVVSSDVILRARLGAWMDQVRSRWP